jgi:hypothetical protein
MRSASRVRMVGGWSQNFACFLGAGFQRILTLGNFEVRLLLRFPVVGYALDIFVDFRSAKNH